MPRRNETVRPLIKLLFSQDDLERQAETAEFKRDPLTVAVDRHVVERDFEAACSGGKAHEAAEYHAKKGSAA